MIIYSIKKVQIKTYIEVLLFNKVIIIILAKHFNYNNIFLAKNIIEFLKYTKINDYAIKLKKINNYFLN